MYIKQIFISGFKSYQRDTTIGPFNAGFNLIAGPNGSGKSSLFMAIQLIFSDEYAKLNDQLTTELLHSSTNRSNKIKTILIKITLDNSDNSLNLNAREVLIARKITIHEDHFFINRKKVFRVDIMDLFASSGISTFGNYFAINQDHVSEIIMASNARLLKILQKVSNCQQWEDKLPEINRKIDRINEMIVENDTMVSEFQTRFYKLETEKDRHKGFQELKMKQKTIIHCILTKQLEKIQSDLHRKNEIQNDLFEEMPEFNEEFNSRKEKFSSLKKESEKISKLIEKLKQRLAVVVDEKMELEKSEHTINSRLTNLKGEISTMLTEKRDLEKQLENLTHEISAKKNEIGEKKKLLKNHNEDEKMIKIKSLEEELRVLFLKSSRSKFFKNKKSKDNWLKQKIVNLKNEIAKDEKCCGISRGEYDEIVEKEINLRDELNRKHNELKEIETNQKRLRADIALKNKEYEEHQMSINALLKKIHILENDLEDLENSVNKCNKKLSFIAGKSALVGKESVDKILEAFTDNPEFSSNVKKYHGLLINKIRYEEGVEAALEAVAQSRLFYHIVEKDDVATWIIDEINEQNLPGTVNFLSINRMIKSQNRRKHQPFPNSCLLIDKIEFDSQFKDVIHQIFGDYYLCKTLEDAAVICKKSRKPCVTVEGSLIEPSGLICGGAYYHQDSAMSLNQSLNDLKAQKNAKLAELNSLRQEKNYFEVKVVKSTNEKIELEVKSLDRLQTTKGQTERVIEELGGELQNCSEWLEDSRKNIKVIENSIKVLKEKVEKSENEIGREFIDESSNSNQERILNIQKEIERLRTDMRQEIPRALEMEEEIKQLEAGLNFNLLKKEEQLKQSLREINLHDDELTTLTDKLNVIEDKKEVVSRTFDDLELQNQDLVAKLEDFMHEENKLKEEIDFIKKRNYHLSNRRIQNVTIIRKLQADLENTKQKIEELGVGIEKERDKNYQDLQKLTVNQLNRELQVVINEVSTYQDMNLEVVHQLEIIKPMMMEIQRYKNNLDEDFKALSEMIKKMTEYKSTAIKKSIENINSLFKKFVKRIIPTAEAELLMEFEGDFEDSDDANDDRLIGVDINITLHNQNKSAKIRELSRGQKTMVSLSLIFAIQEFYPSPFYLFDEIDDSLDENSRRIVGEIIKEQSKKLQFIVVSFRPEFTDFARQFFSVTYSNSTSTIASVTRQDVVNFIKYGNNP